MRVAEMNPRQVRSGEVDAASRALGCNSVRKIENDEALEKTGFGFGAAGNCGGFAFGFAK